MKVSSKILTKRLFALVLSVAMLFSMASLMPASAFENGSEGKIGLEVTDSDYRPDMKQDNRLIDESANEPAAIAYTDELVRVSIVLDSPSTLDMGFSTIGIADNASAMSYRAGLKAEQEAVTGRIESSLGNYIDVVWNMTLAGNIISANVRYSDIEAIKQVSGVKDVVLEQRFAPDMIETDHPDDPLMATAAPMTGANTAWTNGFTGAGSKIAIIDTGIDVDHQSFNPDALLYSLNQHHINTNVLMTADQVKDLWTKLNISQVVEYSDEAYVNAKIPFGVNYVDHSYNITHLNDTQSSHGSHVAGIAAANAYIPVYAADGTTIESYEDVTDPDSVHVKGIAPDAQLLVMKVFGLNGGAYISDYIIAIEDAIVLGADSVNLSLGSPNGYTHNDSYQEIFDSLANSDTVVTISAGNEGAWDDYVINGALYSDDVSFNMAGTPGVTDNSIAVASINNAGYTDEFVTFSGLKTEVYDSAVNGGTYSNLPLTTIIGEHPYIYANCTGEADDINALAEAGLIEGRIVIVNRGTIPFSEKANNAAAAGAIAVVVANSNAGEGLFGMDLSDYKYTAPVVSISYESASPLFYSYESYQSVNSIQCYMGTAEVTAVGAAVDGSYIMSDFSSWGVPGSLELKPEITAPGGSIQSVWGANNNADEKTANHDGYFGMSGTSMAAPQVAGMSAVIAQYVRQSGLNTKLGLSPRAIAQALLMSTAEPVGDPYNNGYYYPVLLQGAGLANVGNAVSADSLIMMNADATDSYADGKVKAELGDDPTRSGHFSYSFTVNNMKGISNDYSISTELFTQAIEGEYLSHSTTPLAANVTYLVNGVPFNPTAATVSADVDHDGDTDVYDAVAILDYLSTKVNGYDYDLVAADVDHDGDVTTYDAHIILCGLGARITVPANSSIEIVVDIQLTGDLSAYKDGAYVEGYTILDSIATEEGLLDVDYSIPIIGFYGSWTDPSMYEPVTFLDDIYDGIEDEPAVMPYIGAMITLGNQISYIANGVITYNQDGGEYVFIGNPYAPFSEVEYPADQAALRTDTVISKTYYSLIRNASQVLVYVTNSNGDIVYATIKNDVYGEYYRQGSPLSTYYSESLGVSAASLGLAEGDTLTVNVTAIPEYYTGNGHITAEEMAALVKSGAFGYGATLSTKFKLDDTAPELGNVYKSVEPDTLGDLSFTVTDNSGDLAYVAVMRRSEALAYAEFVHVTSGAEINVKAADLEGCGEYLLILAADYAGNETYKLVKYDGTTVDTNGTIIGADYSSAMWSIYDPATVAETNVGYEGIQPIAPILAQNETVTSPVDKAVYLDGYVFYVGYTQDDENTALYAAPVSELDYPSIVGKLDVVGTVNGLATYNGMLYAMTSGYYSGTPVNIIYEIDPLTGVATVHSLAYQTSEGYPFSSFAIDKDGNCYADVPKNSYGSQGILYTWQLSKDSFVTPTKLLDHEHLSLIAMAYSDEDNAIYASGYYNLFGWMSYSYMYKIDLANSTMEFSNTDEGGSGVNTSSIPMTPGLVAVPSNPGESRFAPSSVVDSVSISDTTARILLGNTLNLEAYAMPWTLTNRDVTWTSSNAAVASVDQNGLVTALSKGTTNITATSVLDPSKSATCAVEVTVVEMTATGILGDTEGTPRFFTWDFSTGSIVYGNEVAVYPLGVIGTETGEFYAMDPNGRMYKCDAQGNVISDPTTWDPVVWALSNYSTVAGGAYSTYGYYVLGPDDPLNPQYYGFNFQSSGSPYFYGVAVSDESWETDYNGQHIVGDYIVYAIDDSNVVWQLLMYNGGQNALISRSDALPLPAVVGSTDGPYSGLVVADDGTLFYSIMTGSTNEVYHLIEDEETGDWTVEFLGTFGDQVWPGLFLKVTTNNPAATHKIINNGETLMMAQSTIITRDELLSMPNRFASAAPEVTDPVEPTPDETTPVEPAPDETVPAEPTPDETVPAEPAPDETVPAEPAPDETVPAEPAPDETVPVEPTPDETAPVEPAPEADPTEPVRVVDVLPVGSLNAIIADSTQSEAAGGQVVDTEANTASIAIATANSTNGLVTVKYNPSVLKFSKLIQYVTYGSYTVDETNGVIIFSFASANELTQKVADVVFTYDEAIETELDSIVEVHVIEDSHRLTLDEKTEIEVKYESDEPGPDKPGPDDPGPDVPGPDVPGPDVPGPVVPEHTHFFLWYRDSVKHWQECPGCGMRTASEPHIFVDGTCIVCAFAEERPDSPDEVVPDDSVDVEVPVQGIFETEDTDIVC